MSYQSKKHADSNQLISSVILQNLCIWEISANMLALDRIFETDDEAFQLQIEELDRKLTQKGFWAKLRDIV